MSFMPTFLDFDGIKYLFNMAKISIELESIRRYIMDIKKKIKEKVSNIAINKLSLEKEENIEENLNGDTNNGNKNFNNESLNDNNDKENNNTKDNFMNKLDINNNSEKKPSKITKSSFSYRENLIFKKKLINSSSTPNIMKKIFELNKNRNLNMSEDEKNKECRGTVLKLSKIFEKKDKNHFDIENMPEVKEINNLRKKIIILNNQIEEMKNNEIRRIFIEYTYNDYERVYHAPIEVVLGALIGEHSKNLQINNYNIFRKGYLEDIRNIRFYEHGKRK